jgi:acetolactate synthase-1/2/3 large subunit
MAIGAAFANPNKKIVVFTGDGGIQFNMQEISTILGWNLPIHIFVFENQGYASLRSTQRRYFGGRLIASSPDSNLFLPSLAPVMNAYGISVSEVFKQSELKEQALWNLKAIQAVTILHLDPECPIEPRLGSTLLPSGNMVSDPLEDLSPHLSDSEFQKWMLIPSLRGQSVNTDK